MRTTEKPREEDQDLAAQSELDSEAHLYCTHMFAAGETVMNLKDLTVLLVEDNEDDVFFLRRALRNALLDVPVQVASDGQEALDYLRGKGKFTDRTRFPIPSLILLDLKLPFIHGLQALSWIREQTEMRDVPVFVLTSSSEEHDRHKATELGAKRYHVKPPSRELIADVTQALEELRLQSAR